MGTFTKYLQLLADYAGQIDAGTATGNGFIEYQHMEADIIEDYKRDSLEQYEYRALMGVYHLVKDNYRELMHLRGE